MIFEKLPGNLMKYKVVCTMSHEFRNTIEIEGIEFSQFFVRDYPDAVEHIIKTEVNRRRLHDEMVKERLDRVAKNLADIAKGKIKDLTKGGIVEGPTNNQAEVFIPLERLHEYMRRSKPAKSLYAIVNTLYHCMSEYGISIAYYSGKPVMDAKKEVTKVIETLRIEPSSYDHVTLADTITFCNGSKIVFVSSVMLGNYCVVAPVIDEWVKATDTVNIRITK
jgi:hypothetical protein